MALSFFLALALSGMLLWSLSDRLRLPTIVVLLAWGSLLDFWGILANSPLPVLLAPLSMWLVFLEGGSWLGRTPIEDVRSTVTHLASVGPKLGWLIYAFLAQWILKLEATESLLLGAILMIGAPYALESLLARIQASDSCRRILLWESHLVSLFGAAWAGLVYSCLLSHQGHPKLVVTIKVTLWVAVVGLALGWLAYSIQLLSRRISGPISEPIGLSACLLCFSLGMQIAPGSGMMAAAACGYLLTRRPVTDQQSALGDQVRLWVLGLLIVLQGGWLHASAEFWTDWPRRVVFALAVVGVARPLLVAIACRHAHLTRRERLCLSLVNPRGALALAVTSSLLLGLGEAREHLLGIVYWVVLVSNLLPLLLLFFKNSPKTELIDPTSESHS